MGARVAHPAGDIYEYRPSPARFPLPGAVMTPGTPRRLDYARKKLSGEPVGEYWIGPASNRILAAGQHVSHPCGPNRHTPVKELAESPAMKS